MERLPQKILATVDCDADRDSSHILGTERYWCLLHSWKPLGRPRYKWLDNIKMDLSKIGYEGVNG
jgi:hypothetical protein